MRCIDINVTHNHVSDTERICKHCIIMLCISINVTLTHASDTERICKYCIITHLSLSMYHKVTKAREKMQSLHHDTLYRYQCNTQSCKWYRENMPTLHHYALIRYQCNTYSQKWYRENMQILHHYALYLYQCITQYVLPKNNCKKIKSLLIFQIW